MKNKESVNDNKMLEIENVKLKLQIIELQSIILQMQHKEQSFILNSLMEENK